MIQYPLIKSIMVVSTGVLLGVMTSFIHSPDPPPEPPEPPTPTIIIETHQSATFEATGYAIGHPYNTITKNGQPVVNKGFIQVGGVDIFTIAVDPKIIPLGSLVYIDSLGVALATDTGPAVKNMLIDICFTNMNEAMKWGRRDVKIHILRRGK